MTPIEPIENFVLSRSFLERAQVLRNERAPQSKTETWSSANANLERHPLVWDLLCECFHVTVVEGGFGSKNGLPFMTALLIMTFCSEPSPVDTRLFRFDKLTMAMTCMSPQEQEAIKQVFVALVGQDMQEFFSQHRPDKNPGRFLISDQANTTDGCFLCERTGRSIEPEVFAQRFWVKQTRIIYTTAPEGCEPDPTPSAIESLLGTYIDFESAIDALIDKSHDGSLKVNMSLHLCFYDFTLLQGYQETKGFAWQKPGHEYEDIPDYYDARCGFTTQELGRAVLEREAELGYGERLLEDFLLLDLGL
jgi:hypothetical protein